MFEIFLKYDEHVVTHCSRFFVVNLKFFSNDYLGFDESHNVLIILSRVIRPLYGLALFSYFQSAKSSDLAKCLKSAIDYTVEGYSRDNSFSKREI